MKVLSKLFSFLQKSFLVFLIAFIFAATATFFTANKTMPSRYLESAEINGFIKNSGDIIGTLPVGEVLISSPRFMGYGKSEIIYLRLSSEKSGRQILSIIDGAGRSERVRVESIDQVRFGSDMEAKLTGSAFEITEISSMRQYVGKGGEATWTWEIKPKELGEQELHLALIAHLKLRGQNPEQTVQTMRRTVTVGVVWPETWNYFFFNNWQWFFGALITLLPILFTIRGWMKNRRNPGADGDDG